MTKREWYMINNDTRRVYDTYKGAQAKAAGYRIDKLVIDKDWEGPEEEWVVPTDEDAKRRPMVEVRYYGGGDLHAARLLAVVKNGDNDCFVVDECFDKKPRIENYAICHMKASERKVN